MKYNAKTGILKNILNKKKHKKKITYAHSV